MRMLRLFYLKKYSWNDAKEDEGKKDCFGTSGHGLKLQAQSVANDSVRTRHSS